MTHGSGSVRTNVSVTETEMASGSSSRTARGGEQEEEEGFGAREGCVRSSSGARVAADAFPRWRRSGRGGGGGARVGGMLTGLVLLVLHGAALANTGKTELNEEKLLSFHDAPSWSQLSVRGSWNLDMTEKDGIIYCTRCSARARCSACTLSRSLRY